MAFCVVGTCCFFPTTIIVTPRSRVCFPLANGTRQKWLHSSGPPFPAQSPIDPLWQQSQKICRAAYSNVPSTPGQRCARRSGSGSSSPSSTCTSLIKAMAGAQSVHVDRPTPSRWNTHFECVLGDAYTHSNGMLPSLVRLSWHSELGENYVW